MSCSSHSSAEKSIMVGGDKGKNIVELVKVNSIEEANRLLKENHLFLSVYYNQAQACEEYILGKLEKPQRKERSIGFRVK